MSVKEFTTYHPIVNLTYFVFVIGFSMFFMHPLCLAISLGCSFTYSVMLNGVKAIKTNLVYMLPMLIFMAALNPLFNHQGATVLCYFPGGNPLTLESVLYGLATAAMISSVICWFSCYNEVMTSDKVIYLFGKSVPAISLIISMTLRFVPTFIMRLKEVATAQKGIGRDVARGKIINRARNGLNILSITTNWSLENAIQTADSMKSRGYGLPGRTTFSIYKFDRRDIKVLLCTIILGIYTLTGGIIGQMHFDYFPHIYATTLSYFSISVFCSYLLLCMCPIIIELWEVRKWKALKSKI